MRVLTDEDWAAAKHNAGVALSLCEGDHQETFIYLKKVELDRKRAVEAAQWYMDMATAQVYHLMGMEKELL